MILSLAVAALAEPAAFTPTLKVSGLLFPRATVDLPLGTFSEFALDRTYLRADARVTEQLGARITLDSARYKDTEATLADGSVVTVPADRRHTVFVKHAWLEWRPTEALSVRGGLVDTPLVSFVGSKRDLRWIDDTFVDEADLASSADAGVNLTGNHADGLVSWCAGAYNGETVKSPESGFGKSVQARFTVDALARGEEGRSLQFTVFGNRNVPEDGAPIVVGVGDVYFAHPWGRAGVQVAVRSDEVTRGLGQSAFLAPEVPDVGYALVRVDRWDPDVSVLTDDTLTVIAGAAHDFREKLSLGAFYRRATAAAAPGAAAQSVSLQAQIGF